MSEILNISRERKGRLSLETSAGRFLTVSNHGLGASIGY
jgi:hypothetical protein